MDATELKDVMGRYRDLVYRIAYTYLRNPADADDVTQDVFVQLMRCDVAFESDEHVRRWLARVAINRCKSLFRMSWRWIENIDDHARTLSIPDKQEVREVLAALLALPEKYRVPLVLYYYGGFSTNEVAALLKIPPATARTRLARGRAKLKADYLEDDRHEE